jgi:hypothetical protein
MVERRRERVKKARIECDMVALSLPHTTERTTDVTEHSDVPRFRTAISARTNGGAEAEGLFADSVVWHGITKGKDAVLDRWSAPGRDGTSADVTGVYADGVHTVATVELSRGGNSVEQAMIFHLADGTVTDIWSIPTEDAVAEALATGQAPAPHRYREVFEIAEETRERNTFEPDDLANIHAFLREDVEWHGAGDTPGVKGRDQVIGLYQQFKAATGGTMHLGMGSMFIDDDHAASIVHLTATRADNPEKKMDVVEVNLFHLDENGKAYEFWGVPDDQEAMDAFWT